MSDFDDFTRKWYNKSMNRNEPYKNEKKYHSKDNTVYPYY
jgi:hypothetical protein